MKMLESITLKDFTVFEQTHLQFVNGLNVIVGENGTGKTHVLKLCYTLLSEATKKPHEATFVDSKKSDLEQAIGRKLLGVFKPDGLTKLIRRVKKGNKTCEVACVFQTDNKLAFTFNYKSGSQIKVTEVPKWIEQSPVYLPTRELLTIYPGFVSLYEKSNIPFEETWRDTCLQLGLPLARGPREAQIKALLDPLETAMGGTISSDDAGRFFLNIAGVPMEMHLVAEGLRKLAMIARLVANGSLSDKGYLFWDEPESNLNPKVIKVIARTILSLCQIGIQVFIASHSLFLLRELDILSQHEEFQEVKTRFIGLHRNDAGVETHQGPSVDDIGQIDALQEELSQSDRYLGSEAN
jgi:energy-coupling factor transporter ATP-binding protein EcfA2